MHMADALISPAVGGTMWAVSLSLTAYSIKKLKSDDILDTKKIPVMGVSGAFIFAAQMINFAIPATGSSGHLSGGLLLASLLGPYAGFLVMSVVLLLQALLFSDGGLLALGCNIFNMGFYSCFLAYPLIVRPMLSRSKSKSAIFTSLILGSVATLLLGAFSVSAETWFSGITELNFSTFSTLMLSIHLPIGIVEGVATAFVLVFLSRAEPSLLDSQISGGKGFKRALAGLFASALILAAFVSWFASQSPDGLEWSVREITGETELSAEGGIYSPLSDIQETTGLLPDYNLKNAPETDGVIDAGVSLAGSIGVLAMLVFGAGIGLLLKRGNKTGDGTHPEANTL